MMAREGQNNTFHIQAKSEDSLATIDNFYRQKLEEAGWEKVTVSSTGQVMRTLHYRKEKRHTHVNLVDSEDGSVMVSLSTREEG